MSTDTKVESLPVVFDVTDTALLELRNRLKGLKADTKDGYEEVRLGIAECRELRVAIEKRRVQLKADALAWGKKVDGEAKRITAALESIEEPLKLTKKAVDDEKDRIRREKEEAEKRRIEEELRVKREAEEARLKAERDAETARLKAEREALEAERKKLEAERAAELAKQKAEQERIAAEQRVERERLDRERAELEAKQAEERKRIEDERRALAAERERVEREEFQRQAKIKAEEEAKAKVERERAEAQRRAAEQEAERLRLESLKPDITKLHEFATRLRNLDWPFVSDESANECLESARNTVMESIETLESFGKAVLV